MSLDSPWMLLSLAVVPLLVGAYVVLVRRRSRRAERLAAEAVTEARDPTGQFFTEKRMLSVLEKPAPSAAALVANVVASLQEHNAGAEPHDDVTILAVRRLP